MNLSVVVATLNGRDALASCLDALAIGAPTAEWIVVNGPSADGTTGMVRSRDDVDVLLELADRNVNVARNAGIAEASGDAIAFVDERTVVDADWAGSVTATLADAAVATGPVFRSPHPTSETIRPNRDRVAGRDVTFFDGANVALRRDVVDALDGFDEYLEVGGARDAAHRLAGLDVDVGWSTGVRASRTGAGPEHVDGEHPRRKYRALAYRLAKNYGPDPDVFRRVVGAARTDGIAELKAVVAGGTPASRWLGDGTGVARGSVRGFVDGLRIRLTDRRPSRNPHGVTSRDDRVVQRYDRE